MLLCPCESARTTADLFLQRLLYNMGSTLQVVIVHTRLDRALHTTNALAATGHQDSTVLLTRLDKSFFFL